MAKITKECVRLAIERIKDSFNDQPSPKVRYDNHTKKISVIHDFCFGTIPKVKIITSREDWFDIYHNIYQQTFSSIQDSIHPKGKKEELKQYAEENLERFRDDLLIYATAAHSINPVQYSRNGRYSVYKKRKSSHYDLSLREKNEVSNMAVRLYVYLYYDIGKKSPKQWPSYVKRFLDAYGIPKSDLHRNVALQGAVKGVMVKYFGLPFGDRFWQTFVVESPIGLERVCKLKRINPEEDPFLKELFKEFMD